MKPPLDPGLLPERIELEEAAEISDGAGGFETGWKPLGTFWGRIEHVTARTVEAGGRRSPTTSYDVLLRFNAVLRPGMRLRCRSRTMLVETVHDPDLTGRFLICRASEEG